MAFPKHVVIVTAAGSSERFNASKELGVKKEYLSIDGHTVLYRSIAPFLQVPNCAAILVTYPEGMEDQCAVALEDLLHQNFVPLILVKGGKSRQESVYEALRFLSTMALDAEFVAIHDGARCFVSPELIIRTLATAKVFKGAVPALPATDALKIIDDNGMLTHHIDRTHAVGVQTPQIFKYPEIWEAHQQARNKASDYIDDTQVFTDFGLSVGICEGERENRKITYMDDIPDAEVQIEQYLKNLEEGKRSAKAARLLHQAMDEAKREQAGL
ncbi:IspD/TarI family cytidylyltransferase [Sphaerochaeta sp.]|jgi:2-C-methyl-D-erythritol 4-phosphate cytidylyltransferase|uniref:IspD/TarI family cytidylyltransferase n=1 Tax=Sphaerochaeta sp. TaxID=1972642 RepID=UPI00258F2ECF|nr:IspD/TarI family cytidylyltransferase [Sphaerochaeta sp.]MDD3457295.1 IspD/TarI family cytidylyltransferase [Sphaerochaeta sp.]MDX9985596.1 IspD/TarI family cytidylyltransferase [Sphaerochaeta sp.]